MARSIHKKVQTDIFTCGGVRVFATSTFGSADRSVLEEREWGGDITLTVSTRDFLILKPVAKLVAHGEKIPDFYIPHHMTKTVVRNLRAACSWLQGRGNVFTKDGNGDPVVRAEHRDVHLRIRTTANGNELILNPCAVEYKTGVAKAVEVWFGRKFSLFLSEDNITELADGIESVNVPVLGSCMLMLSMMHGEITSLRNDLEKVLESNETLSIMGMSDQELQEFADDQFENFDIGKFPSVGAARMEIIRAINSDK
jgi:hypothetical protein